MTETKAVIEIGSTGIRLLVVELTQSDSTTFQWQTVDKSELPIPLGRDVFTTGIVSRDTLVSCLHIIYRFQEQGGSFRGLSDLCFRKIWGTSLASR